jgi:hypothetical protein
MTYPSGKFTLYSICLQAACFLFFIIILIFSISCFYNIGLRIIFIHLFLLFECAMNLRDVFLRK